MSAAFQDFGSYGFMQHFRDYYSAMKTIIYLNRLFVYIIRFSFEGCDYTNIVSYDGLFLTRYQSLIKPVFFYLPII